MVLHGVSNDVRDFVVTAVIHSLHSVQDATLNGFQTVGDVRHGTFQNYIGSIVQKPVLVHLGKIERTVAAQFYGYLWIGPRLVRQISFLLLTQSSLFRYFVVVNLI